MPSFPASVASDYRLVDGLSVCRDQQNCLSCASAASYGIDTCDCHFCGDGALNICVLINGVIVQWRRSLVDYRDYIQNWGKHYAVVWKPVEYHPVLTVSTEALKTWFTNREFTLGNV